MLRAQLAKPTAPIETAIHLTDESSPSPEEEAIRHEPQERVSKAMGHLPEQERELLIFRYYDSMSIREAGRLVSWGKSAADRHHHAALKKTESAARSEPFGLNARHGRPGLSPPWVRLETRWLIKPNRLDPLISAHGGKVNNAGDSNARG